LRRTGLRSPPSCRPLVVGMFSIHPRLPFAGPRAADPPAGLLAVLLRRRCRGIAARLHDTGVLLRLRDTGVLLRLHEALETGQTLIPIPVEKRQPPLQFFQRLRPET